MVIYKADKIHNVRVQQKITSLGNTPKRPEFMDSLFNKHSVCDVICQLIKVLWYKILYILSMWLVWALNALWPLCLYIFSAMLVASLNSVVYVLIADRS